MSPKKSDLEINVTKDIQDFYPESHETLLRKSKNDLNNRRICSQIRKNSIIKILPQMDLKFSANPISVLEFFCA